MHAWRMMRRKSRTAQGGVYLRAVTEATADTQSRFRHRQEIHFVLNSTQVTSVLDADLPSLLLVTLCALEHGYVTEVYRMFERLVRLVARLTLAVRQTTQIYRMLK